MQTDTLLVHLRHIPDYLSAQWNAHMGICIIIAAVYLVALFLIGNTGKLLRKLITAILVLYVIYGIILKSNRFGYQIVLIGLIALTFMGITRLIINMVFESRKERMDAQIEREALERAASRRGKFRSNASEVTVVPKKSDLSIEEHLLSDSEDSLEDQIKAARAAASRNRSDESDDSSTSEDMH